MKFLFLLLLTLSFQKMYAQEGFDPFIDYSEFEVASEEEADVNFFRNGRFLSLAVPIMPTQFTSNMGQVFGSGTASGISISYFFDLRLAIQISLLNSSHAYADSEGDTGTLSLNSTLVSTKYFFNMQNVTKGLSNVNPFIIAGVTQAYRRLSRVSAGGIQVRDGATGFHIGVGVEVPIVSNKMFIGAETKYTLISFPDENTPLSSTSSFKPVGDILDFGVILGINF